MTCKKARKFCNRNSFTYGNHNKFNAIMYMLTHYRRDLKKDLIIKQVTMTILINLFGKLVFKAVWTEGYITEFNRKKDKWMRKP
ncbi:12304_t:CDS:2 [Cetraspora pellucida]|uniref:12304_t:CDS:1 n=1 Tax=Cetraspora pellucida TaxID=1433469 RepID=A0A9N8WAE4_9GLOM|nr:12304_t:CDS:2 [Cetraspora pellucida]